MERKPLRIGSLTFEYPFVLAPLAGITDRSMRSLCSQAGASLTFTEMVSAKGLWYGDHKTSDLLRTAPGENIGFQLFGCEPAILEYAVRILSEPGQAREIDMELAARFANPGENSGDVTYGASTDRPCEQTEDRGPTVPMMGAVSRPPLGARTVKGLTPPALFDLNAGCPVPKIVRNGEGSALLQNPDLFYDCVAAMVRGADKIPVTVKIRKGFERDDNCAVEIAKAAEAAGAAAVTVHGRTRQQFYEGPADWDVIAAVKAAVRIPVIGNGDVMTGADAIRMMEQTGCDGVMIARGALGNPWVFAHARALWDAGAADSKVVDQTCGDGTSLGAAPAVGFPIEPTQEERIDMLLHHIDLVCEDKGEHIAVREMRKHIGWYIRGMRGAAQIRRRVNSANTIAEMKQILQL